MSSTSNFLTLNTGPLRGARIAASSARTAQVLSELLTHTLYLRDCYKWARRETTDPQYRLMQALFAEHHAGQVRLVNVLIDRLHQMAVKVPSLVAQLPWDRAGCHQSGVRDAPGRLLQELLNAHEETLVTARSGAGARERDWVQDFAVGQVVLTNDLQVDATRRCLHASGIRTWSCELSFPGEQYE